MEREKEKFWEVRGGIMIGKSGGTSETVLHKNHKDSQEGQHEIVSEGDARGTYSIGSPYLTVL